MSREAMQMALEALDLLAKWENPSTKWQVRKPKDGGPIVTIYPHKVATDAAIALRQALEEKREPVGYFSVNDYGRWEENEGTYGEPLYTAPPKQWVGLTDAEKSDLWCESTGRDSVNEDTHVFADAIEAKLREKNHG